MIDAEERLRNYLGEAKKTQHPMTFPFATYDEAFRLVYEFDSLRTRIAELEALQSSQQVGDSKWISIFVRLPERNLKAEKCDIAWLRSGVECFGLSHDLPTDATHWRYLHQPQDVATAFQPPNECPSPGTCRLAGECFSEPDAAKIGEGAAVAAIKYIIKYPNSAGAFCNWYSQGNWDVIRERWPDAPNEIYPTAAAQPVDVDKEANNLINYIPYSSCPVCKGLQFQTPSGLCCSQGHGF